MDQNKPTLAIYGIQDRTNSEWPLYVHDHSLALFEGGKLKKLLQLERKSRAKRDNRLYQQIYSILKEEKLIGKPYDLIFVDNVVGRAFISTEGNIRFEAPLCSELSTDMEKGISYWVDGERDAYVLNHELSHIFSCLPFYGNFKENSLLIHFDGGGSKSNFSAWVWKNNQIQVVEYHWDLKYLSSFFNANGLNFAILGANILDQNAVPGKLMGFASFGTYSQEIELWLKENDYFQQEWKSRKNFFEKARERFGYKKTQLDLKEPFIQDVVATFQEIFTRDLLAELTRLQNETNAEYLYYTGGSALNIVANNRIIESNLFQQVYIPPCAEDSGLALGAAAYMEYQKHGEVENLSPYLNNWGIEEYEVSYTEEDLREIAKILMEKKVIGVCNSYGEVGPRALGNRSILALANDKALAGKVSIEHKGREWYRPIAPIMLKENLEYFTGRTGDFPLSKYMLMDFQVIPEKRKEIEGVVHVNGSSRIQTIDTREDNPFIYDLLTYLQKHYNVKALINTSFNKKGEPIVHTIEGAEQSARNLKLDAVVLNGKLKRLN
jgi:carbamoyltransferase